MNLGSSTNVGVNASASSTSDYTSSGFAKLDLDDPAGCSKRSAQQHAFNTNTAAESSARAAHTTATERANSSSYGSSWDSSYNSTYSTESGWEQNSESNVTATNRYRRRKNYGKSNESTTEWEYKSETEYTRDSQASWQTGWDNEYNHRMKMLMKLPQTVQHLQWRYSRLRRNHSQLQNYGNWHCFFRFFGSNLKL